jgi:hypothetical protein
MCHTVIWDVQYGKIRVRYEIRAQYFWRVNLVPISELNWSQFAPKSPKTLPNFFQYIIDVIKNGIESSLKGRF